MNSCRAGLHKIYRRYALTLAAIVCIGGVGAQLWAIYSEGRELQEALAVMLLRSEQPEDKSPITAIAEIENRKPTNSYYERKLFAESARSGDQVQSIVNHIVESISMLTVVTAALLVALGLAAYAYIRERNERYRLSTFPKRNPHPVLALNDFGEAIYVNDGGISWLKSVGFEPSMTSSIFPEDIAARLTEIPTDGYKYWEYRIDTPVGAKDLACGIQSIAGHDEFHAYLLDITDKREGERRLHHQTMHDKLTGLPNRQLFESHLNDRVSNHPDQPFSVVFFSIERFTAIVQGLGYSVSENIFAAVAERIANIFRQHSADGTAYRFDTSTFAIFLPVDYVELPYGSAAQIFSELTAPFIYGEREFNFAVAAGGVVYPDHGADVSELVSNVVTALHTCSGKRSGDVAWFNSTMHQRVVEKFEIEERLRKAIPRGELHLEFQPQIDLVTGIIVGSEALLRWSCPELGAISPASFISIAEDTGMINSIGRWVLREACTLNKAWNGDGNGNLRIAVNVSARQLESPDFFWHVKEILEETGMPPELLELEITESVAMNDVEANIGLLRDLRGLGIRLSIDDFGTGYSSLAYLRRFPVERLKIDRSFILAMTDEDEAAEVVRAVIGLGHNLHLSVIAEGVETMAQLKLLMTYGCNEAQGYLLSRPVNAGRFRMLLNEDRRISSRLSSTSDVVSG